MRMLFSILSIALVLALLPSNFISNAVFEKKFDFAGVDGELRPELFENLPISKSWGWWRFHLKDVENLLESDPRVLRAHVEPCQDSSWWEFGCFSIDVTERTPALVVRSNDSLWLATEDGALIRKVEAGDKAASLPRVEEILSDSPTAEILRARFRFLIRSIRTFQDEVGRRVDSIKWIGNGEFSVKFSGISFETIFSGAQGDLEVLKAEAKRLRRLLHHYAGKEQTIGKIDLAYRKVAVVTPR